MANFKSLLESSFRRIAHRGDRLALNIANAVLMRKIRAGRVRRERLLRREYLNG